MIEDINRVPKGDFKVDTVLSLGRILYAGPLLKYSTHSCLRVTFEIVVWIFNTFDNITENQIFE